MENFPQLVAKWQEKRRGNVQMIMVEQRGEEVPKACVVIRGGLHRRGDASTLDDNQQPWIRKVVEPP